MRRSVCHRVADKYTFSRMCKGKKFFGTCAKRAVFVHAHGAKRMGANDVLRHQYMGKDSSLYRSIRPHGGFCMVPPIFFALVSQYSSLATMCCVCKSFSEAVRLFLLLYLTFKIPNVPSHLYPLQKASNTASRDEMRSKSVMHDCTFIASIHPSMSSAVFPLFASNTLEIATRRRA